MDQPTWTLTVRAPDVWINANKQLPHRAHTALVAVWRRAAYTYARHARLPQGLTRVRIQPVARLYGPGVARDAANLAPTIKAVVDGLGPPHGTAPGWGLIPDDSDRHLLLDQVVIDRGPRRPYQLGELVLTITDLSRETT